MNISRTLLNNAKPITANEGSYYVTSGRVKVTYTLNGELFEVAELIAPSLLLVTEWDENIGLFELDDCVYEFNESFDSELNFDASIDKILNINEVAHQIKSISHMIHHLLVGMPSEFMHDLVAMGQFVHLDTGAVLFKQGDESDGVYFLINGKLDAYLEGDSPTVVGNITRGELFGEMGVLSHSPRTTSIRAARHSELLKINSDNFAQLRQTYSQLNEFITKTLIDRLDKQNRKVKAQDKPLTRVILPLQPSDDLSWLTSSIPVHSSFLSREKAEQELGCANLNQVHATRLHNYLDSNEQQQRCCTYWCLPSEREWLYLALSRADEIWIVTQQLQQTPDLDILLNDLSVDSRWDSLERVLVRSHKDLTKIADTANFLDKFDCQRCFHYEIDDVESQNRIIRFLSNQANGIVLGGGGARGIAHIGLYHSLLENKVHIDALGGTSIGSVMAACIANKWHIDETLQRIQSHFVDINPVGDYTFPFVAISKGRRLNKALKTVFGDVNIEDLPIPFYCVSANISKSTEQVHTSGKLWKAVRASLAIPGVITPAIFNGEFYVDGGLINNLPTNVMSKYKVGKILAHDVSDNEELTSDINRIPSGWPYLWHKLTKKSEKVPSILEVLFRSTLLAGVKRTNENIALADIYLKPDLGMFGMLEFQKSMEIYQHGYDHSMNELDFSQLKVTAPVSP